MSPTAGTGPTAAMNAEGGAGQSSVPTGVAAAEPAASAGSGDAAAQPGNSSPPSAPSRREVVVAVVGCLVGAALVLFSGGATWVSGTVVAATAGGAVAPLAVDLSGSDLAPAVSALGLTGLAAVVAVLATRRTGRVLTGVLLLLVGIGIAFLAGRVLADPSHAARASAAITEVVPVGAAEFPDLQRTAGGWVSAVGGLTLAFTGGLVALRGTRWPTMSGRYERRGSVPTDPWEAIERGEDPT